MFNTKRNVYVITAFKVKLSLNSSNHVSTGSMVVLVFFRNTSQIKSFFPYKDRLSRSLMSEVVFKVACWDCNAFKNIHEKITRF